ncbi:ATP-binding protein, partial [Klebsiella pneumoniae]
SVVAIHAEVRHGDLIVRVTDRGPGLPPEISRMLLRNDGAAAPPPDGHGLGVWTIVRLVERLKGRISVEAPEDGGTTV